MSTDAGNVRSGGAVNTAKPSRADTEVGSGKEGMDYRIIMPFVPSGTVCLNTLFLHANPETRPYNVDHFGQALKDVVKKEDVASFGVYQYNHVWAITLHTALAKEKLLALKEIVVKGQRCVIVDPNSREIKVKIHWIPRNVPDDAVTKALAAYGKLKEICRDKWRTSFFEGIETTTRQAIIQLKESLTVDSLPHQMYIAGCQVLLAVHGRPPLCLRCKQKGHIRRQCNTPWCRVCRRYGHEEEECVSTYATRAREVDVPDREQFVVDAEEAATGSNQMAAVQREANHRQELDEGKVVTQSTEPVGEATKERNLEQGSDAADTLTAAGGTPPTDEEMIDAEAAAKRKGDAKHATAQSSESSKEQRWTVGRGKRWKKDFQPPMTTPIVNVEASQLEDMAFLTA